MSFRFIFIFSIYKIAVLSNLCCNMEIRSNVFIRRVAAKLFRQVEELIDIVKLT